VVGASVAGVTWSDVDEAGLRALAPEAFGAFDAVEAAVRSQPDPALVRLLADHIAALLGEASATRPSPVSPGPAAPPGRSTAEQVALDTATQFVLDVAATTDAQRGALNEAFGPAAFDLAQVLYALDFGVRLRAAFGQVLGVAGPSPRPPVEPLGLWPALEAMMGAVARLGAVDPVTTELVRLRGARTHNCRLCRSRRSVGALAGGADESTFDQIDRYETSDLAERRKVALRLTDAMIWEPVRFPAGLAGQVRAEFEPAEAVELILDVARNATNKIAVLFGADQANVTDGVEYFEVDARGEVVVTGRAG